MTRFAIATAILMASSAAYAGDTYNFRIGGQSVHIEQPDNCNSASCVSVSIPGVYEYNTRRSQKPAAKSQPAETPVAAPAARDKAPAVAAAPAPVTPTASLEPANGTSPAPAAPAQETPRPSAPSAGLASPLVASAPSVPTAEAVAPSPLGVWLTEEKEGKVRIEACGSNLCGYAIDDKTGRNGDKVLVNMKPTGAKWSGRIYDPNGGSTYDSTIALKGPDRLRVQGCAFGGMMCGGQTWTRAN